MMLFCGEPTPFSPITASTTTQHCGLIVFIDRSSIALVTTYRHQCQLTDKTQLINRSHRAGGNWVILLLLPFYLAGHVEDRLRSQARRAFASSLSLTAGNRSP
jgi:hypothetical protein